MRIATLVFSVAAMMVLLAACSSSQGSDQRGSCTIKVIHGGQVYRAVAVQSTPRSGQSLGSADFGDCEGAPLRGSSYTGKLFALPGTNTNRAVLLRQGGHDSVYVNEALPIREWPRLVKAATGYPACERPASFTGTWETVDSEDMPDEGDFDIAVPYTGTFTVTHGEGWDLDEWSSVDLRARVTRDTEPVPSPRFLERALTSDEPVTVTTTCRGTKFDVSTIRFAD